jgi:hypothetical protein
MEESATGNKVILAGLPHIVQINFCIRIHSLCSNEAAVAEGEPSERFINTSRVHSPAPLKGAQMLQSS